jgi:hypothetical protein
VWVIDWAHLQGVNLILNNWLRIQHDLRSLG